MSKLLSMIVLSYRNVSGIYDTLGSIFRQSYSDIEIIISDDASTLT